MQFKHPELLYALLLLLIPIIVHLFQLRRFKEVAFTNVAFLKKVNLQTRKSSKLKKWLTLITRLLLLACIVLAFAQPFTSKTDVFNRVKETVIYLDNSFSMQAKGSKGELLKRAIQDLLTYYPEDEELSLFTNTKTYRNTSTKAIKNDLLQLPYTSTQLGYDAVQLKASRLFNKDNTSLKELILISDFQQKSKGFSLVTDTSITTRIVQLKPVTLTNQFIDSAYISSVKANSMKLSVIVRSTGTAYEDLPISLYDNETLLAKTTVSTATNKVAEFDLPLGKPIDGKLLINDNNLGFDDELFFNINATEKINVLSITGNGNDSYLNRVYTDDEFKLTTTGLDKLSYSIIPEQNLIVLNELKSIPNSLITALHSYSDGGGLLLIIPSSDCILSSYNQILNKFGPVSIQPLSQQEKRITTINYSHPIFDEVFDKRVDNFQYPKVSGYFPINSQNSSNILEYEDGKPFLLNAGNAFIFTSAINTRNSNFKNSPLIVPTLYNIAKQSLKLPELFYSIGNLNVYDVNASLLKDNVLKLEKGDMQIIPRQRPFSKKIRVTTEEEPSIAGIYSVTNNNSIIKKVSYNYSRDESTLNYIDMTSITTDNFSDSVEDVITEIKSDTKINELWKWFVIFALIFLIMEMLILKFFK